MNTWGAVGIIRILAGATLSVSQPVGQLLGAVGISGESMRSNRNTWAVPGQLQESFIFRLGKPSGATGILRPASQAFGAIGIPGKLYE